jgi:hypothetical protein
MTVYEPTIAQALHGNPWSDYELMEPAQALFSYILDEIYRVYHNVTQKKWDQYDDPAIPGITWRPYHWGEDEYEASLPNFTFEDVEIRFYKYPLRGTTTNKDWSVVEWSAWFERCLATIRAVDTE